MKKLFMSHPTLDRTEQELIDKYFSREYTPHEEQDFLVSLASNERLRKLFRAEVLLLQAVSETKAIAGSPAEYSTELFARLGVNPLVPQPLERSAAARFAPVVIACLVSLGAGFGIHAWLHQPEQFPIEQPVMEIIQPLSTIQQPDEKKILIHPKKKNKPTTALAPVTNDIPKKEVAMPIEQKIEKPIEIRLEPWTKDSTMKKL